MPSWMQPGQYSDYSSPPPPPARPIVTVPNTYFKDINTPNFQVSFSTGVITFNGNNGYPGNYGAGTYKMTSDTMSNPNFPNEFGSLMAIGPPCGKNTPPTPLPAFLTVTCGAPSM